MSTDTQQRLIYMVNQIATAFRTQEPEQAAQATYDHLWHYWDPRMRELICAHEAAGGDGLNPIARRAVELLIHSKGEPNAVTRATEFSEARDPDLMSDAG
ncbi:MAG: putative NAD-dependent formate dehydrogenase delta subunit protein [Alphaproteobacteria bacterium]|nr:putative NAD-dependent formate dehydrogenase delta subunit protein [Alphaproteobacteria bacterium]